MTVKRRNYEVLGDEEISGEAAQQIDEMIEQAEKDVDEARVNFRWGKSQLAVIKEAANLIGVPYQTYMKTILFRQALADLATFKESMAAQPPVATHVRERQT